MPDPKPLFRVVDAETGEPVEPSIDSASTCFFICEDGEVYEDLGNDGLQYRGKSLRVEWLLDPTTGKPPRRPGV